MSQLTAIGRTKVSPITEAIHPAVVAEDGSIAYKLNPGNLTQKEDGSAANLDGTDGDVMAVIPDYWWKFEVKSGQVSHKFSPVPLPGYTKIPSHAKGIYMADEDAAGKLRSRSGVTPLTNETRNYFRQAAFAKGSGWTIEPYYIREADTYLAFMDLLNHHSQSAIGQGATNTSSTNWSSYNSYYPVWTTDGGQASSYGSGTVSASPADPNTAAVRNGIIPLSVSGFNGSTLDTEMAVLWWMRDVFGHIWEWVDGINVHNSSAEGSKAYISKDIASFADDTETGYKFHAQLAENDGYIEEFVPGTILPPQNKINGSSGEHVGDYFYTYYDNDPDSGWRVARWGGGLNGGARAGLCYAAVSNASGDDHATVGARLCLVF